MDTKLTESAGGVIVNRRGQVIVVSQRGASWSLPKGHIEAGEDKFAAARREIYEETGITQLEFVKELGNYSRYKISTVGNEDRSELKTIHMFLFRTDEDALRPLDPDNPEARWVAKEEVAAVLTHPKDKEFFLRCLAEEEF